MVKSYNSSATQHHKTRKGTQLVASLKPTLVIVVVVIVIVVMVVIVNNNNNNKHKNNHLNQPHTAG